MTSSYSGSEAKAHPFTDVAGCGRLLRADREHPDMYLVAYDGSRYAKGALLRAVAFADLADVDVEAYTAIPTDGQYAADREWVQTNDDYDLIAEFHEQVATLAPEAEFNYDVLAGHPPGGRIARTIRDRITTVEPDVVFVGSETAGRGATTLGDVEDTLVADTAYDVVIVRTPPAEMTALDADRRDAWHQETDRPKPNWGGDTITHTT